MGTNDSRALIEVFGERFQPPGDEEKKREFFQGRGYRVLVIWARELAYPKGDAAQREAELVQRIKQFLHGQPAG